jgi:hypothetical protein
MPTLTPKETKADYQHRLGTEFGGIYYSAFCEWAKLRIIWNQYENLFCSGPERIGLLNSTGAIFFLRVQRSFFETVVMGICRLNDPVKSLNKYYNITVKQFEKFMLTEQRCAKMSILLEAVDRSTVVHRNWRDKRISHNDLDQMLEKVMPLEAVSQKSVNDSIAALHDIFSFIALEFFFGAILSDNIILSPNNEIFMMETLYKGVAERENEKSALRQGKISQRKTKPAWL